MRYERIGRGAKEWRRLKGMALVGLVILAGTQVVDLLAADPRVGHWRTTEGRDRYATAYAETLASVAAPDEVRDLPTRWGTVRVSMWRGAVAGAPVLLLPGHSSGAPLWVENLPSWIGKRTVYAFDPLGDAGFSNQSLPMTSPDDQASWIADALQSLRVGPVHVVGHSFGGATAAIFAVRHPRMVRSLTLLEPVVVIRPMPMSIYLWSTILLLPTPRPWKDRALAEIGGTTVDEVRRRTPMSVMIDAAVADYSSALPVPRELTDDEWRTLTMPVRVDLGGASTLAGRQGSADRIHRLLPDARVTVWPGATHSLPMDRHELLGPELLHFWIDAD